MKNPRQVIADISEALNNNSLAFHTSAQVSLLTESIIAEELSEHKVAAHSSRLSSATDSTLGEHLACRTTCRIKFFLTINVLISILDPSHFLLARTHIRSKYIILRPNERFLCQLHGVLPRNSLQFTNGVL